MIQLLYLKHVSLRVCVYFSFSSSVHLSEDNIKGANDGHNVSQHVVLACTWRHDLVIIHGIIIIIILPIWLVRARWRKPGALILHL